MIDDPHRSIASPGTNHGLYRIVIQHLLEIGPPLIVLTGKLVPRSEDIRSKLDLQSPFLKNLEAGMYLLKVEASCRGNDANLVAFIQVWWCNHVLLILIFACRHSIFLKGMLAKTGR